MDKEGRHCKSHTCIHSLVTSYHPRPYYFRRARQIVNAKLSDRASTSRRLLSIARPRSESLSASWVVHTKRAQQRGKDCSPPFQQLLRTNKWAWHSVSGGTEDYCEACFVSMLRTGGGEKEERTYVLYAWRTRGWGGC